MGSFDKIDSGAQLNGVSYKKFKSRTRIGNIKLNNDEPLDLAVKKIVVQLFIIVFVIVAIFALLIAKETVIDVLTDDSVFSISMTKKYSSPVTVDGLSITPSDSQGYSVVETISSWSGNTVSASQLSTSNKRDVTATPEGLMSEIKKQLPNLDVFLKSNISNYNYLTEIYDSLAKGLPVITPMTLYESAGDPDSTVYGYGIVTAMDFTKDVITVVNSLGRTDVFSAEDFIAATRFTDYKNMPLNLKLSFTLGINNSNTALFITKEN